MKHSGSGDYAPFMQWSIVQNGFLVYRLIYNPLFCSFCVRCNLLNGWKLKLVLCVEKHVTVFIVSQQKTFKVALSLSKLICRHLYILCQLNLHENTS